MMQRSYFSRIARGQTGEVLLPPRPVQNLWKTARLDWLASRASAPEMEASTRPSTVAARNTHLPEVFPTRFAQRAAAVPARLPASEEIVARPAGKQAAAAPVTPAPAPRREQEQSTVGHSRQRERIKKSPEPVQPLRASRPVQPPQSVLKLTAMAVYEPALGPIPEQPKQGIAAPEAPVPTGSAQLLPTPRQCAPSVRRQAAEPAGVPSAPQLPAASAGPAPRRAHFRAADYSSSAGPVPVLDPLRPEHAWRRAADRSPASPVEPRSTVPEQNKVEIGKLEVHVVAPPQRPQVPPTAARTRLARGYAFGPGW